MTVRVHVVDETPGAGRLGRIVEHDDRSRAYAVTAASAQALKSVRWKRRGPILDQGNRGSCTGNAAAGWLATDTATRKGRRNVDEKLAVEIYSKATHLDRVKGVYPPDDTGSSGLAAAKAMRALGDTSGPYRHAFSLAACLTALQTGPVLFGQAWYEGMDHPNGHGIVRPTGAIRGLHETCIEGVDVTAREVIVANSWSVTWGLLGYYVLAWTDLDDLLHQQGDITVPT